MCLYSLTYPSPGRVLVQEGEAISPQTVLVQGKIPSKIIKISLSLEIGIKPSEIISCLVHKIGDEVEKGEILVCKKTGIFGKGKKEVKAPRDGIVLALDGESGNYLWVY